MGEKKGLQSVQVFGRKKTATAVAHCKRGNGLIKGRIHVRDGKDIELANFISIIVF